MDAEKLLKIMGPMPIIPGGVSQDARWLGRWKMKALQKKIDGFRRRFPQCRLHLMVRTFPQKMELPVILFWIFNQAGLSLESARDGRNRDIVILIEPDRKKAGMIVGYGLEPLISQEDLDAMMSAGHAFLKTGKFVKAFGAMVAALTSKLEEVSREFPRIVGKPERPKEELEIDY